MGKAKKPTLRSLPSDWREQMWATASTQEWRKSRPQLLPALALLWLTGCRPAELAKGVKILASHGQLKILVEGVKCKDAGGRERGQPQRVYVFSIDDTAGPAAMLLHQYAAEYSLDNAQPFPFAHKASYLYNCIVALAKCTFPKMKTLVSPYCFRHQTGSDLKADPNISLEFAARFMGHLSDYSIGKYGRAVHGRKGSGTMKVDDLVSSRPIRHSRKVDRLARFKLESAKRHRLKLAP